MVSAQASGSDGLGSRPDRGHCVVLLDKILYSHSASLHPGVQMGSDELKLGCDGPASHPVGRGVGRGGGRK